jgi:hypothetical protein
VLRWSLEPAEHDGISVNDRCWNPASAAWSVWS